MGETAWTGRNKAGEEYQIRMATPEDAPAVYAIYEPYILNTPITYEYEPVLPEVFRQRIINVLKQFPWLVCEKDGRILGYAYCSRFRERAAYDWDAECSVYVDGREQRKGIATMLYDKLFELLWRQGYYTIYALITRSHSPSIALHRKLGFTEVGVYEKTGYKFGQWWDLQVMEKRIRSFEETPQRPRAIHEILAETGK